MYKANTADMISFFNFISLYIYTLTNDIINTNYTINIEIHKSIISLLNRISTSIIKYGDDD